MIDRKHDVYPLSPIVDVLVASKHGRPPLGLHHIPWRYELHIDSTPGWAVASNQLLEGAQQRGRDAIFLDDDVELTETTFRDFEARWMGKADIYGFALQMYEGGPMHSIGHVLVGVPSPQAVQLEGRPHADPAYLAVVTASLMLIRRPALVVRFPEWPGQHFEDVAYCLDAWLQGFHVAWVDGLAYHYVDPALGVGKTKSADPQFDYERGINHQLLGSWVRDHDIAGATRAGQIPVGTWPM